ncbi:MAG: hypothetical protein JST30_15695 [Armatimonadetes bacterium]|nr:hypothetical protein [Armatimonadota bacterium]
MTTSIRNLCLAALAAMVPALASANAVTLWTNTTGDQTYGVPGWQNVLGMPGSNIVSCTTLDDGAGQCRAVVRSWGKDGGVRWTYEYPDPGAPDFERFYKVCLMPDDTIVVAGNRSAGNFDELILARLDLHGNEIDRASIALSMMPGFNGINDLVVDGSGDLYLVASQSSSTNNRLVKVDGSLNLVWDAPVNAVHDIEVTATGKVAVCGYDLAGGGNYDAEVALFDLNGAFLGSHVLYTDPFGDANELDSDSAGFLYVAGGNGHLYKFGPNGTLLWDRASMSSYHTLVRYDERSDTVYFVGSNYFRDLELVGFAPDGTEKWHTTRGAVIMGDDIHIELDPWGNVVVAATVDSSGTNSNMKAFCYSSKGEFQWGNETEGTGQTDEAARALAIDPKGRLTIVGGLTDANGDRFGHAWRTSQFFHDTPDSATVRIGRRASGNAASLTEDDGNEYVVCKFVVPNQSTRPIVVEFDTDFPVGDGVSDETDLRVRVRARANTIGLAQWIQLYDWQTGTWTASANYGLTLTEQQYDVSFPLAAPYFEPGTTHVKARIAVGVTGPVSVSLFCVAIDQFELRADSQ